MNVTNWSLLKTPQALTLSHLQSRTVSKNLSSVKELSNRKNILQTVKFEYQTRQNPAFRVSLFWPTTLRPHHSMLFIWEIYFKLFFPYPIWPGLGFSSAMKYQSVKRINERTLVTSENPRPVYLLAPELRKPFSDFCSGQICLKSLSAESSIDQISFSLPPPLLPS